MKPSSRHASLRTLCLATFFSALLGVAAPLARAQRENGGESPTASPTPVASPAARDNKSAPVAAAPVVAPSPQTPATREQREQAYAKLLEGQRYFAAAREGGLTPESLRLAQRAFQQSAGLDPSLAEAHTALAEIAFFFLDDLAQAEREASAAVRVRPDNFGARRILSRIYALKSGLPEDKLDRAIAERAIAELREITRLEKDDAEAWALLGEIYLAMERDSEAIDAFTRWLAAPSTIDGRFFQVFTKGRELTTEVAAARLAETLLKVGRQAEALAAVRRAIAIAPDNADYLELLGRALEASSTNEQNVLEELRRIVALNPANNAAISLLAQTEARYGRMDDAVATLRAALDKHSKSDREYLALQIELAQLLGDALRFDEAAAIYDELLKARGIGVAPLASDGDKSFAVLILQRIIGLRRQAGQDGEALAAIERMRRLLGREDPSADIQYVTLLRAQGKRREALEVVRAARLKFPERVEFLRLEAATLANLGRVEEAATLLRTRLTGALADYDEYLAIASLFMEVGRGREAVEAANKALELAPSALPKLITQALIVLASAQDRAGDAKGSEESLRRVLLKEPNNATALNNLGYFLVERDERLAEALSMIQRAVRSDPTNASFLDSLGWAHYKLGQLEDAERHLSDAARRSPSSVTIQEHLGDLYQRRGKTDLARAAWRKALSLSVEANETARIKAKLGSDADK